MTTQRQIFPDPEAVNVRIERCTIILYARYPTPGKVKSRLAQHYGGQRAAAFYSVLLDHALSQLKVLAPAARIVIDAAETNDIIPLWKRAPWVTDIRGQSGDDLGERMHHSFTRAFSEDAGSVLLVGSDIPGLASSMLVRAALQLKNNDIVFGPARDGGYWLIGLKQPCVSLFTGIIWGEAGVLDVSMSRARTLGMRYTTTEVLHDIDTHNDLVSWCSTHPAGALSDRFKNIFHTRESLSYKFSSTT